MFLTLLILSADAQPINSQLDVWNTQNQPIKSIPELSTFVSDFGHAFLSVELGNGKFISQNKKGLVYEAFTVQGDMDKDFFVHLQSKYAAFLNDRPSPQNNFSLCFNSDPSNVLYVKNEFFTSLLDTVDVKWKDIAPYSVLEYKAGKKWFAVTKGDFGQGLFDILVRAYYSNTSVKLSATDLPEEFDSVLELTTEDQKTIRLPVAIDSGKVFDDTKLFWIVDGETTKIEINLKNATHLQLLSKIIEKKSVTITLRETLFSKSKNVSLEPYPQQAHLIDGKNHWYGKSEFEIQPIVKVSTSDKCDVHINYLSRQKKVQIKSVSKETWSNVTKIHTIDSTLYNYNISYSKAPYDGGRYYPENKPPYISYTDFDERIERPKLCSTACEKVSKISQKYIKSYSDADASPPLLSSLITVEECSYMCLNSYKYAQCLDEALHFKLPLSATVLDSRAYAIKVCQEGLSKELIKSTSDNVALTAKKTTKEKQTNPILSTESSSSSIKETEQKKQSPTVISGVTQDSPKEDVNLKSTQKVKKNFEGIIFARVPYKNLKVVSRSFKKIKEVDLCRVYLKIDDKGIVIDTEFKFCEFKSFSEEELMNKINSLRFEPYKVKGQKVFVETTIPLNKF